MNLIDILRRILDTKRQIKDIINSSAPVLNNDFSRYSVSVYNYLASAYNEGFVDGYSEYYFTTTGVYSYPAIPLSLKEDTLINTTTYDPYTVDGAVDIMSSVLGFREDIRDEIHEFEDSITDYFETYPSYLNSLKESLYQTGLEDGASAAEDSILPETEVLSPSIEYSNNTFTLSTDQEYARLWFKIGIGGVETEYNNPITLFNNCRIYYWAKIGSSISNSDKDALYYDAVFDSENLDEETVYPQTPEVQFVERLVYIIDKNEAGTNASVDYCINYDSEDDSKNIWYPYTGPISISSDMDTISVRSATSTSVSDISTVSVPKVIEEEETPTPVVFEYPAVGTYSIDYDNHTITLACETEGAGIEYNINGTSEGEMTQYTGPFSVSSENSFLLYVNTYLDYPDYGKRMYHSTVYKLLGYLITIPKVRISTLSDGKAYIFSTVQNSTIEYSIQNSESDIPSSWISVNTNRYGFSIDSKNPVWIFARAVYNDRRSEIETYYYDWYTKTFTLPTPSYTLVDNYLKIQSDYVVYYTTDGSDPMSKENQWGGNLMTYGLAITEPTTIKAVAWNSDSDGNNFYSETVTWNLVPEDIGIDYRNEYFNFIGASSISFATNGIGYYYSYDKNNWIAFDNSATGLDVSRIVYIKSSAIIGGRTKVGTISFVGDSVTVSGNVVSLFFADNFRENTTGFNRSLRELFSGCTNLVDASNLFIPNTEFSSSKDDFYRVFYNCTSLVAAPKELYITTVPYKYSNEGGFIECFRNCSSLISTPSARIVEVDDYGFLSTFFGCTSLVNCNIVFDIETKAGNQAFCNTFNGTSNLKNISFRLGENCSIGTSVCEKMFYNSSDIDTSNIKLDAVNLNDNCYNSTFEGSRIKSFSVLPATTLKNYCYYSMFKNCKELVSAPSILATTLGKYSLAFTFFGCTSLTTAPILYAHTLTTNCYLSLFNGCGKLNKIIAYFLDDPYVERYDTWPWTERWVEGVAETGTFIQDTDATWNRIGINAIPIGWTLQGVNTNVGTINSITIYRDKVTISSLSNDRIQYQLNGTSEDGWIDYTSPFTLSVASATVYARCINSRGITSEIVSEDVVVEDLPKIGISTNNNTITLTNPEGYYSNIYYAFVEYGTGEGNVSYYLYSEPIPYSANTRILVKGKSSGGLYSEEWYLDCVYQELPNIPSPTIHWGNDYRDSSTFNTWYIDSMAGYSIWYRINNIGEWIQYSGSVTLTEGDRYSVSAYYKDDSTGRVSSSISRKSVGYTLHIEAIISFDSTTNTVSISSYGNLGTIRYRTTIAGDRDYKDYTSSFTISESCTVYAYVRYNGSNSSEARLYCEYHEIPVYTLPEPVISVYINGNTGIEYIELYRNSSYPVTDYRAGQYYGYNRQYPWIIYYRLSTDGMNYTNYMSVPYYNYDTPLNKYTHIQAYNYNPATGERSNIVTHEISNTNYHQIFRSDPWVDITIQPVNNYSSSGINITINKHTGDYISLEGEMIIRPYRYTTEYPNDLESAGSSTTIDLSEYKTGESINYNYRFPSSKIESGYMYAVEIEYPTLYPIEVIGDPLNPKMTNLILRKGITYYY